MPALRHPCICLKPAPKGDGHVDVDLQCSPVATRIYPRLAATRTKKRPLSKNGQDYLEASNRRAELLLHAAFGL